MGALSFQPVGDGLYAAPVTGPVAVYWVLLDGTPPSGALDAAVTWSTYSGCYVFMPADQPVSAPATFAAAVAEAFGPPQSTVRALAWVNDPTSVPAAVTAKGVIGATPGVAVTGAAFALPFANVAFSASADAQLSFDPTTPSIAIAAPTGGGIVGITRAGVSNNLVPNGAAAVPLTGTAAGTVTFNATWDPGELYTFFADLPTSWDTPAGGEIRYFYGPSGGEQTLRYPVFLGATPGTEPNVTYDVALDPFDIWNTERTVFAIDGSGPSAPQCVSFAATTGDFLTLVPQAGAGVGLGQRPMGTSTETAPAYSYLVPTGTFTVQPTPGPPIRHVLCGMAATEYLLLAPGATITLVPGKNAYAPLFTPPSGNGSTVDPCKAQVNPIPVDPLDLLTDSYTTAWVRIDPPAEAAAPVDRGYAMQPASSVYYSPSGTDKYPLATGCRISTLLPTGATTPLPVPLVPYGQVWATGAANLPPASAIEGFESQIIAPTRFAVAPKDEVNGPMMFDTSTHTGLDGGAALTPEGLLANLNDGSQGPAGTFAQLMLAISPNTTPPQNAAQLSFNATPDVLEPDLSYALMQDNLFMVATAAAPLGGLGAGFSNEIAMGEWTFAIDVPTAVLVFKFTTAFSVVDLVSNAAYWSGWETFIGTDPKAIGPLQAQINQWLCEASPNNADPSSALFADFWEKVNDPSWTGILALNCGIDASDLPIDLQDLLGGISGELRAHHFGVTVNRVKELDGGGWALDSSSMFALIHYVSTYSAPASSQFGFQVLRLNVLFENSVQSHFDAEIAVTIPTLFGSPVTLATSPVSGQNVIEIAGSYQVHGDSGTVVFSSTQPEIFTFNGSGMRVIQQFVVTDATLVPVSSTTSGGTITVQSAFTLSGVLVFVADVSGSDQKGIDLFSYGDASASPPAGLAFDSYSIAMTTTIADNVGTLAAIGPDVSQFRVSPATSPVRVGSILAALPLKLVSFVSEPSSQGWPVTFDGQSKDTFAGAYALQFQASLGSLGALTSVVLEVNLTLAWQPASDPSQPDQVWLLMVPPPGMLGQLGFGIQGVLDTTFRTVGLNKLTFPSTGSPQYTVYAIYFTDVEMQILSIPLIPGNAGFSLFADPSKGSASNIAWLMSFNSTPA